MKYLKLLRKQKNMSQLALAESIGVTQAAISAFENGEKTPSVKTLKKLALEFECSTNYLLYGYNSNTKEKKNEQFKRI